MFKDGDIGTITGTDKLIQDILKILMTPIGGNYFNPAYGSYFSSTLIGSYLDKEISVSVAGNKIKDSLENLKTLQELQQNQYNQKVLPSELLAAVQNVSITNLPNDPRGYSVAIKVLTKAFNSTTITLKV